VAVPAVASGDTAGKKGKDKEREEREERIWREGGR
jgi:hypothetical protein